MGRAQALVRDLIIQCEWIFEKFEEVEQQEESEQAQEPDSSEPKEEQTEKLGTEEAISEVQEIVVGSI